jgi:para-aminobenzoate synthetase component 1
VRKTYKYSVNNPSFKDKLLQWCQKFTIHSFLNSNEGEPLHGSYECLAACDVLEEMEPSSDSFEALKSFYEKMPDWLFGYFAYDLKNEKENLSSDNKDQINFPVIHFFRPRFVFEISNGQILIHHYADDFEIEAILNEIISQHVSATGKSPDPAKVMARVKHSSYLKNIETIKKNILKGRLYEMNYCQEFYIPKIKISPLAVYHQLNRHSPTPFSCFYKLNANYLMCASPERFLKKKGNHLVSQPIKGTIARGHTSEEDEQLKENLRNSEKERAENIMIVDLVRNDLAQTAIPGSVRVDELCQIYSFQQVHQMISTISSRLSADVHFIDAIKAAFPMGSMTGAPKISAMQLIEEIEETKRGLYSGALGYIKPDGDFDFNVVIRSIQYNANSQYLNFIVGSAITASSIAEKEYEECLIKAKAMLNALNATI